MSKTLNASDSNTVTELVPDVEKFGNPDLWVLICKASSKSEKWMKSTKAMDVGSGCLVQVTTQQGDNVAEALCFIPYVSIHEDADGTKRISRL